ncbi:homoserine dehydrogenase [Brevundimonas aveniformis]|uniref:homoserine dehydrogenase n=1 Tax=Brevundimonas aveniformis TaxID=370977 RepID=UPI002492E659|nr:hypothetical protein [Brevundimonas aveniformis]
MTAQFALNPLAGRRTPASDPVALIHVTLSDERSIRDAASDLYRQARQGRRAVAVVSGAVEGLARQCDQIGLGAVTAAPHAPALVHEPVVLVPGTGSVRTLEVDTTHRLRIVIAGCGVVGGGLYFRLVEDPRFDVVGVLVRTASRLRSPQPDPARVFTQASDLLATGPDVVIDCLSEAKAGLDLTREALERGISVISANKQAIGDQIETLTALATARNATLACSAAVGGGAPVIETLLRAKAHGPVARIEGVLNGTVNFLLNQLCQGCSFGEALADARLRGFAEEDPSSDLEGHDAAAKITILSSLAWGSAPPILATESLTSRTQLPSGPVRQIARADAGCATISLEPVTDDTLFADLPDEWNALRVICEDGTVFTCSGRGAGRWPTAESVWADLLDLLEACIA